MEQQRNARRMEKRRRGRFGSGPRELLRNAVLVLALAPMMGCIGGRVLYANGTPYAGATVTIAECTDPGCDSVTVTTDQDGIYIFDPYTTGLPTMMNTQDGVVVTVHQKSWETFPGPKPWYTRCYVTEGVRVSHATEFTHDAASGKNYTRVPDIYIGGTISYNNTGAPCPNPEKANYTLDSDLDGLANSVEAIYGTDPNKRDTDGDDLGDGLEILGAQPRYTKENRFSEDRRSWWPATDFAYRGGSPFRKDLFVEVDYHVVRNGSGTITQTMFPSQDLRNAISNFYAGLTEVTNVDGSSGINVAVIPDQAHELAGLDCNSEFRKDDDYVAHRHLFGFTHGLFCGCDGPGQVSSGCGGRGFVPGTLFQISTSFPDSNSSNDTTEIAIHRMYAVFLHELGHNLGLRHGGHQTLNCKPNYPSLMNYSYDYSFNVPVGHHTLSTTQLQYSPGAIDEINEWSLVEYSALSQSPSAVSFLQNYNHGTSGFAVWAWPQWPGSTVDWNRSGLPDPSAYPRVLRACEGENPNTPPAVNDYRTYDDHNDFATIISGVGGNRSLGNFGEISSCAPPPVEEHVPLLTPRADHYNDDVRLALERITGREGAQARQLLVEAGVDPVAQANQLAKLQSLSVGRTVQRLQRYLYPDGQPTVTGIERAEQEVVEVMEHVLEELAGRRIEVSFVDCQFDAEELAVLSEMLSPDSTKAPGARVAHGTVDRSLAGLEVLELCR